MGKTNQLGVLADVFVTDASNNVGIGGSPSGSYKLEVTGTAKVSSTLLVSGAATFSSSLEAGKSGSLTVGDLFVDNPNKTFYVGRQSSISGDNTIFIVRNRLNSPYFYINPTNDLAYFNNCNVGIGTNSPSTIISGARVLQVDGSAYGFVLASSGSVVAQMIGDAGGNVAFGSRSNHQMTLTTNDTQRFLITYDGYISLNNVVYGTTTAGTTRSLYIGNGSGLYYIGGISSIRASKDNINDLNDISWLYKLRPVSFNYRKQNEDRNYTNELYDELNYGLIAEEVEPINNLLCNYTEDEDKKLIGLEYNRLITPMLKAIQEMNTKFEEQQATITSLQDRLTKGGL